MPKQKILVAASLAVLAGIGFFIYSDFRQSKNIPLPKSIEPAKTGTVKVGLPGAVRVESVTSEDDSSSAGKDVPVPDLSRSVSVPDTFSAESKKQILARVKELTSELSDNPNFLNNWLDLGVLRKMVGDYDGAREAWEYGNAIRPKNIISFLNLGDLYHYYLKDYPKAEQNLLQSIKNDPSGIASYRALYDLYTQSYTEKLSAVPALLTGGLKSNPDNYDLLVMFAGYYKSGGDRENALVYYNKALAVAVGGQKAAVQAEIDALK